MQPRPTGGGPQDGEGGGVAVEGGGDRAPHGVCGGGREAPVVRRRRRVPRRRWGGTETGHPLGVLHRGRGAGSFSTTSLVEASPTHCLNVRRAFEQVQITHVTRGGWEAVAPRFGTMRNPRATGGPPGPMASTSSAFQVPWPRTPPSAHRTVVRLALTSKHPLAPGPPPPPPPPVGGGGAEGF